MLNCTNDSLAYNFNQKFEYYNNNIMAIENNDILQNGFSKFMDNYKKSFEKK